MALTGLLARSPSGVVRAATSGFYEQTNLVSDQPGVALLHDVNLVNAWGIALNPTGAAFWVANNVTGTSTLYLGDVNGSPFTKAPLIVTIPGGSPTGTVFNPTTDFVVHSGASSGRAIFLFASQAGIISGWNPAVPPSTQAHIGGSSDAVYTGLAIGHVGTANYLYAIDFEHAKVDLYDKDFHIVQLSGSFRDPTIPRSYSPFNIQNLDGLLYVTYAQQDHQDPDEETDHGAGFVNAFDTSGRLVLRVLRGTHLHSPWGIALAPSDFGPFSNALVVGNFANGHIQRSIRQPVNSWVNCTARTAGPSSSMVSGE